MPDNGKKANSTLAPTRGASQNAVDVVLYKKGFTPSDYRSGRYDDYITVGFVFKNKTEKDIRGFTGTAVITDIFDKEITKTRLSYDKTIPAGETVRWNGQMEYNQFDDGDRKLKDSELENLKLVWKPEKVIFTDGSHLGKEG